MKIRGTFQYVVKTFFLQSFFANVHSKKMWVLFLPFCFKRGKQTLITVFKHSFSKQTRFIGFTLVFNVILILGHLHFKGYLHIWGRGRCHY